MLGKMLAEQGDTVFGLVRNSDQGDDLHAVGVGPVACDLVGDDDAAAERKRTMDLGAALRLIDAARAGASSAS